MPLNRVTKFYEFGLIQLLTRFGKNRRIQKYNSFHLSVLHVVISNVFFYLYDSMKRIVKLFWKKEIVFHQSGSWRENFSNDSTVRIFIWLSVAVLRIVRWSINLRCDISSVSTSTSRFAKSKIRQCSRNKW